MRNLKKILALVLALVMSMSLVTIANAADFTDDSDINYKEAVDVMNAIGVIDGLDTGAFNPKGTLTREQAAKIICTMMLGENADKLGSTSSSFTDVAVTRWSSPYIEYCVSSGILAGVGNGQFNPTGKLTGYAFAKMLLVALGYNATTEGYVGAGWSIEVAKDAVTAGITVDGVAMSAELTREQAAQMAFQTLESTMVEYKTAGSSVVLPDGTQIITSGATASKLAGSEDKNYDDTTDGDGYMQFCEQYFDKLSVNKKGQDDFGAPANVWTYKDFTGKYAKDADLTYTTAVKVADLEDDLDAADLSVTSGNDDSTTVLTIYSNGTTDAQTLTAKDVKDWIAASANKLGGTGILTKLYDKDDNDVIDTIVMVYTYAAKITDVTEDDEDTNKDERDLTAEVYMGGGNAIVTLDKDTDGFEAVYSNVEKDDIVLVVPKTDSTSASAAWSVAIPDSVTGAVTGKKSDTVTVGGTAYDIAACQSAVSGLGLDIDKDVILYLDTYGNAIYTTSASATTSIDVVYVTYAYTETNSWGETVNMFQGVLTDGTVVTGEYEFDGTLGDGLNKAYKYEMDGDTYVLSNSTSNNGARVGTLNMTSYSVDKNDRRLVGTATNFFDGGVQFVYVSGSKGDLKVTVKDGVQTVEAKKGNFGVISEDADGNLVVSTVFVNSTAATASDDLIYVASSTSSTETTYGPDGKTTLYGFEVYLNGEKTTIYKDKTAAISAGFYTYTVDDTTGVYTLSSTNSGVDTTSIAQNGVTYIGGSYYVTAGSTVVDYDATDAKVIDTTDDGKAITMSKLKSKTDAGSVNVAVVFDSDAETVEYIYVK